MSWISPTAKVAMNLTRKHGPKVVAAWAVAGKPVTEAARARARDLQLRSQAVRDADTRDDGSVLPMSRDGRWLWVVYSGDRPVAVYPSSGVALADLVETAKLSDRFTPEQFRQAQLRTKAKRIGQRTTQGARGAGRAAGQAAKRLQQKRRPDA